MPPLLQNGTNLEVRDPLGRSPLGWAAISGHGDVAQLLIDYGAGTNVDMHEGRKPLHYAAQFNHSEVVRSLLSVGVDPLTRKARENSGRKCGSAPKTSGQTSLKYDKCIVKVSGMAWHKPEAIHINSPHELDNEICSNNSSLSIFGLDRDNGSSFTLWDTKKFVLATCCQLYILFQGSVYFKVS